MSHQAREVSPIPYADVVYRGVTIGSSSVPHLASLKKLRLRAASCFIVFSVRVCLLKGCSQPCGRVSTPRAAGFELISWHWSTAPVENVNSHQAREASQIPDAHVVFPWGNNL